MFALRPYQVTDVTRIRAGLREHRRVLYQLPTGGGKTVTFAYITQSAEAKGNGVLITAHREKIVKQISGALSEMGVRHGLIMSGHTMTDNLVQVGMVQTVARRLTRIRPPKLMIVDEAHHGVAGQWRAVADAFPLAKHLLVTATPERLDGKPLGDVADTLIVGPPMADLIGSGFLADYRYLEPPEIDLSAVHMRAGDYAVDELASVMDRATIHGDVVAHYRRYLNGAPAIAFCVTVEHAEHVAEEFRAQGFRAASIHGKTPDHIQDQLFKDLARGMLNVLTSCELISEGVDVPAVAGAILLRPTKSLTMYLQQVGRALRLKPDGSKAIILDHVGNRRRHGMPDEPREWSLTGKVPREAASLRRCPKCFDVLRPGRGPSCGLADLCPMLAPAEGEGRPIPQMVAGELVEANPYEWAEGIDIKHAKGDEWKRMLDLADGDRERLKQIARIRGFNAGWVQHVASRHQRGVGPGSDFEAREFG